MEHHLPPRVEADLDAPLSEYWFDREAQHVKDVYAGVRMQKLPEDLRVYEQLLWISRSDTVIELGTNHGGSALWFRDRLATMATQYGHIENPPHVITVDMDHTKARAALGEHVDGITFLEGDVTDPGLATKVAEHLHPGARCLVVEDTLHTYATTKAALDHFHDFVPEEGFFVVEDGIVDVPALRPDKPLGTGVLQAVSDFLDSEPGRQFRLRRDLERYGLTGHPCGYLQRAPAPSP